MTLQVFVALGSNLPSRAGEPQARVLVAAANALIARHGGGTLSRLYRTAPVDCPPGSPEFVNAVLGLPLREGETPQSLHHALIALEREAGRAEVHARAKNAPRPLDLDLLAYGDHVQHTPTLTIPHPRCHLRAFVLEPWAEIALDFEVPGRGTVGTLWAALRSRG